MAINVLELMDWLHTLDKHDYVYIDEGGLTLLSEQEPDACIEVGGQADFTDTDEV